MRESVIYQEIHQDGVHEGIQKSRKEGLHEGMQKGIHEGMQKGRQEEGLFFITSYLRRKFGALDPELHKQLQGLSVTQLEDLVNVLFDFEKLDDLKVRLQQKSL